MYSQISKDTITTKISKDFQPKEQKKIGDWITVGVEGIIDVHLCDLLQSSMVPSSFVLTRQNIF